MTRFLIRLIGTLKVGTWPIPLRRPFIQLFLKRKSLVSFPFRCKLHGFDYTGDAASLIDYHILSRGSFEPGLTHLLNFWGSRHTPGLFLDVGANVGVHSIGASRTYATIIAVEPYPPLVERLRKTIKENAITHIVVVPAALGRSSGKAAFIPPGGGNLGTGRIDTTSDQFGDQRFQVNLLSGDLLLEEYPGSLIAIKIDVEGFETDVLDGLRNALAKYRPLVICELLSGTPTDAESFKSRLPEDYSYFTLEKIKQYRFTLRPWSSGAADVVAVPNEKADLLSPFIQ